MSCHHFKLKCLLFPLVLPVLVTDCHLGRPHFRIIRPFLLLSANIQSVESSIYTYFLRIFSFPILLLILKLIIVIVLSSFFLLNFYQIHVQCEIHKHSEKRSNKILVFYHLSILLIYLHKFCMHNFYIIDILLHMHYFFFSEKSIKLYKLLTVTNISFNTCIWK